MHVYTVCTGLKLLVEGVDRLAWWVDPKTGHKLKNATYIRSGESPYCGFQPHELKGSSIYTYERKLDYSLDLGCHGRDWHCALAKMVGFDRENPDDYPEDGPFIELLHYKYSGAEFGPSAARKIVADFDAWNDRASKVMEEVGIYKEDDLEPKWLDYRPLELVGVEHFPDDEFYLTYWYLRCCFGHAVKNGVVTHSWQLD